MRDEIVLTGRKTGAELALRGKNRLPRELAEMPDGEVVMTIRKLRATRSAAANAYYWGVIIARLQTRIEGMSADEIHEYVLKPMFLTKKGAAVDGNGEIVGEFVVGGSTKRLNKNEFYEYCQEIRRWAAEKLGLDIPSPDVDWRDKTDACHQCGEIVPVSHLTERREEWADGGQSGVDIVRVCRSCDQKAMRRTG